MILATPPATKEIPTAIANAWIVIPGQDKATIPTTSHTDPTARDDHGRVDPSAEAISLTPVRINVAATTTASTDKERKGFAMSTAPDTTHAPPSRHTTHHGKRRAIRLLGLMKITPSFCRLARGP